MNNRFCQLPKILQYTILKNLPVATISNVSLMSKLCFPLANDKQFWKAYFGQQPKKFIIASETQPYKVQLISWIQYLAANGLFSLSPADLLYYGLSNENEGLINYAFKQIKSDPNPLKDANVIFRLALKLNYVDIANYVINHGLRVYDGLLGSVELHNDNYVKYFINRITPSDADKAVILLLDVTDYLDLLVNKGADINFGLDVAINKGNDKAVEFFVGKGADITNGLSTARMLKKEKYINYFLELGAK